MPSFNEHNLTECVVQRFDGCESPRLKQLIQALTRHLHAFVKETALSQDEWMVAIEFLTRTGQTCTDRRQEFILLSDVLGVSMLADAINHRMPEGATETTVLGPFYLGEHRLMPNGADLAPAATGERLYMAGTVRGVDGQPLAGATIDVWHADRDGFYDAQKPELGGAPSMRGRFRTDAKGCFSFRSLVPASYPIPHDGPVGDLLKATGRHPMRPAHVHFHVSAPGHEALVTHVFFSGDPWLESDAVFGVKDSLVVGLEECTQSTYPDGTPAPSSWKLLAYDFRLKRSPS
ncbi:intradiol ring-cleavage dioxygenase [Ramlibacter sp. 2FC]|uniref:intradiol ring-cleavage dioxygenase n=1 Tax=Ramlibacter sp. 2FC TaxID=2502188 RepID=UPI0010F59EA9|nr:intradiol ring-cleavage dioxygenase [Ramlibacter sp. 2FC]